MGERAYCFCLIICEGMWTKKEMILKMLLQIPSSFSICIWLCSCDHRLSPWSILFLLSASSFPLVHVTTSSCILGKTLPWPPQPSTTVTAHLLYSIHKVSNVCICHPNFLISHVLFNLLQCGFHSDPPLHQNSFCCICQWLLYQLFSIVYHSLLWQFTTSCSLASKTPPFFVVFLPLYQFFLAGSFSLQLLNVTIPILGSL